MRLRKGVQNVKIAICDDREEHLDEAMSVTERYTLARPDSDITFEPFRHPEDLLRACEENGGYDIYILDIVMPDMNGITLGEKIRGLGFDGKIIYLTSSEEYSLAAFRVKAFDYLIKPLNEAAFFKTLDEASEQIISKKDKHILVKSKSRSIKITYDSIVYAELSKRAVRYYLTISKTVESVTLRIPFNEACADLLADYRFFMCSQSMIVNLDHITEIENDAVIFGNAYKIFLGEKTCRKLRSVWSEYLFEH